MNLNTLVAKPVWTIESSGKLVNGFLLVMGIIGLFIVYLLRNVVLVDTNSLSAFWVGILLITFSIGMYLIIEKAIIRVDENQRKLFVSKTSKLGIRDYQIPFDQIEEIRVTSIGKSYRGVVSHHLIINLKNGKREVPGSVSLQQQEVIKIAHQLAAAIGCEYAVGRKYQAVNEKQVLIALIMAVVTYFVWKRVASGEWVIANEYRFIAPMLIGLMFISFVRIFRRL